MNLSENIIHANEENFEYEVLSYSENTPVLVDFWAEWCKPCQTLGPILERLAEEAGGAFRLAKVNVDENPNLALRYGVRSIPAVKAIVGGEITSEFTGMQPLERVRQFVAKVLPPSPLNLSLEKADSLFGMSQYQEAEDLYREILDEEPQNPAALFGLARVLLRQGRAREALLILRDFPASPFYLRAQQLRPLAEMMIASAEGRLPDENAVDAAFANAMRLAARGKVQIALDGLLDVLRQDKRYRGGKAREIFLALLEVLGEENPDTRGYRAELSSVLF